MKNSFIALFFVLISAFAFGQKKEVTYQLSSHILDVSKGMPAPGVTIKLEKFNEAKKTWTSVQEKVTDKNGRVPDFLPNDKSNLGIYKLTYYTSEYFKKMNTESFYPWVEVVFQITNGDHYHVPITLSAYGYSTYRGN
ncbi:hydroxyisourate hydrolase [Kaistella flava (ex Peng et al. 2021)]|uniref:5-hydroxyisourate hydrolase n=1 Tax=Kaistella flava (ex Peng et al. 2021) TaxID=2038776 RepID=A0A7M2Y476_9FLAO|nr:hydroxyisourate hydrolase [Kaistella flava (ex Peng et al. 2021)]QOW08910.1 hydroxyisourate hydrolase [Kaistella flava (ex Peng et al. 2021)]